jgi:hypothetical protein
MHGSTPSHHPHTHTLLPAFISKAFFALTARRKNRRGVRVVAFITVLADDDMGQQKRVIFVNSGQILTIFRNIQ